MIFFDSTVYSWIKNIVLLTSDQELGFHLRRLSDTDDVAFQIKLLTVTSLSAFEQVHDVRVPTGFCKNIFTLTDKWNRFSFQMTEGAKNYIHVT